MRGKEKKPQPSDLLWQSSAGSNSTKHLTAAAELDGQMLLSGG